MKNLNQLSKACRSLAAITAILISTGGASAVTITMTNGNGFGASSFVTAVGWSDGAAPSAGNDYANNGFLLRTPTDGLNHSFAGDSLTITGAPGSGLALKGTGVGETITVTSLRITSTSSTLQGAVGGYGNGGVGSHSATLAGNITLSGGTTAANSPQISQPANTTAGFGVSTFNITANISGSSGLTLTTLATTFNGSQKIVLSGANTYTRGTFIGFGGTGNRGLIFVAAADGTLGSGNVSYVASNGSMEFTGGTLNNYIGDTATLSLLSTLPASSVNLNFTGADIFAGLSLDGGTTFLSAPGTYGATGSGADFQYGVFTGSGFLQVVPEPSAIALASIGLAALMIFSRRRR